MGNPELRRDKQYDFYKYHFTIYCRLKIKKNSYYQNRTKDEYVNGFIFKFVTSFCFFERCFPLVERGIQSDDVNVLIHSFALLEPLPESFTITRM